MTPLPHVVLLPGMDGTATLFAPIIAALAPGTATHPVAYPPDRALDYDDLDAFVRAALPAEGPFLVVAESFSGPIAIRLAADPPPGLAGVLLVASFATNPSFVPAWLGRALRPLLGASHPPRVAVERRLLGPAAPPALVDALMAAIRSVDPPVMGARQVAVLESDVRPLLARAQVPMGYLQAAQDRVVPARCAHAMGALLPGLWHERIPGPHLLLQREPAASAEALKRWWSTIAPG